MWLLFTVSILLAREVVGNLSTDKHNEEKKMENKNDLHNFSQLQTTDLKIPAEKLHEIDKSNKKQGDFFKVFIFNLFIKKIYGIKISNFQFIILK